jgi:hypothetical protein
MGLFSGIRSDDNDTQARLNAISQGQAYTPDWEANKRQTPLSASDQAQVAQKQQQYQEDQARYAQEDVQRRAEEQTQAQQQAQQQAQNQKAQAEAEINKVRSQATQFAQARSRGAVNLANPDQSKLAAIQSSGFGIRGGINQSISSVRPQKPLRQITLD